MSDRSLIVKLGEILTRAEKLADECRKGILKKVEVHNEFVSIDRDLQGILTKDSVSYRIFDRRRLEHTDWSNVTVSGYADDSDLRNINYRIETISKILNLLDPEFLQN